MMEMLKKLSAFMRGFNAASAGFLADMLGLLADGKTAEEVAIALNESEGEFPQWCFGIEVDKVCPCVKKILAHANYYDALATVHLADGKVTYGEFGTVSGHGVSFTIGATGDVALFADGVRSALFWGDALADEPAKNLRGKTISRQFFGEEPLTQQERERYFLEYANARTVGRGIRNRLVIVAKEAACAEGATEASVEDAVRDERCRLMVWGEASEADVRFALQTVRETLRRLEERRAAEAHKAWHDECLARQAERRNTPGTRAWRRHQRRLGLIA